MVWSCRVECECECECVHSRGRALPPLCNKYRSFTLLFWGLGGGKGCLGKRAIGHKEAHVKDKREGEAAVELHTVASAPIPVKAPKAQHKDGRQRLDLVAILGVNLGEWQWWWWCSIGMLHTLTIHMGGGGVGWRTFLSQVSQ